MDDLCPMRPVAPGRLLIVSGCRRSGTAMSLEALRRAGLTIHDIESDAMPASSATTERPAAIRPKPGGHAPHAGDAEGRRLDRQLATLRTQLHTRGGLAGCRDTTILPSLAGYLASHRESFALIVYRDPASCVASVLRREVSALVSDPAAADALLPSWHAPETALETWRRAAEATLALCEAMPERTLLVAYAALRRGLSLAGHVNRRFALALDEQADSGILVDPDRPAFSPAWPLPLDARRRAAAEALLSRLHEASGTIDGDALPRSRERAPTPASPAVTPGETLSRLLGRPGDSSPGQRDRERIDAIERTVRSVPDPDLQRRLRLAIHRELDRLASAVQRPARRAA